MNAWYRFGYTLFKIIGVVCFRYKAHHREKIIEDGPAILAMNHQSFLDPPLAGIACRKEVFFLARKSLLDWPVLGKIFPKWNLIPVNLEGADASALKTIIRLLKEGHRTIVFPEGSRTRDGLLQPAQPGLGLIVAKTLAPVVPMRVFGAYEAFPRGARFPRLFRKVEVVVGDPIRFDADEVRVLGKAAYQTISDRVMAAIAAIELPRGPSS